MRLLFIIDSLGSGGAQRQMVNLAIGLAARSHRVDFFVYYPEYRHFLPLLRDSNIQIHTIQKQGRFDWRPIRALRELIRSGVYDLALAFLATPAIYLEIAAVGLKVPVVVSERSTYMTPRIQAGVWCLQQIRRLADHITVNSYHQYRWMVQRHPWMRPKLNVIYNGIDLNIFHPVRRSPSDRMIQKGYRFLVLSSVVPNKNTLGLIQALVVFQNAHPEYRDRITVQWAGKMTQDRLAQEEFKCANELLEKFRLHRSWQWLGERTDVPDLLRKADALIHPAFHEGLPNAICEALASGLPVLASNIGDHPRLIEHGKNGFLFSPTEPVTIANAIYEFCNLSEADRAQMPLNARRFAEENLSMERFVQAYENLFMQLIADRGNSEE